MIGKATRSILGVAIICTSVAAASCTKYELVIDDPSALPQVQSLAELCDFDRTTPDRATFQASTAGEGVALAYAQARVWDTKAALIYLRAARFIVKYGGISVGPYPVYYAWLYVFKGTNPQKWFGVTIVKALDAVTKRPQVRIHMLGVGALAGGSLESWLPIPDDTWVCDPGADTVCASDGELFAVDLGGNIRPLWLTTRVGGVPSRKSVESSYHLIDLGTRDRVDELRAVRYVLGTIHKRPDIWQSPITAVAGAAKESTIGNEAGDQTTKPDMVFVSGGPFTMGCNESVDSECRDDEKPWRTGEIEAFWIDKTEVTVRQYRHCVDAGRCSAIDLLGWSGFEEAEFCNWEKPRRDDYPINCVDWSQAVAYCEWARKRLPSDAEWEKAARGTDARKYPWGLAAYGSGDKVANIADESAGRVFVDWEWVASGYDDGYVGTAPVGSFPAGGSPYGALDMIGNVSEWVWSSSGGGRATRGGSWRDRAALCRTSMRSSLRA